MENANYSYYDNLCLFKDEFGQSYSYDKNGNLIATQDKAKQNLYTNIVEVMNYLKKQMQGVFYL